MRRLRAAGIDAWFKEWEVAPGDDVVGKINDGITTCDVSLIFFSKATASGAWVSGEISALVHDMLEKGRRAIPVMIEEDVELPPLLRARARRGIDEIDVIVDAILGRSSGPPLGPAPVPTRQHAITLRLTRLAPRAPGRRSHPGRRHGSQRARRAPAWPPADVVCPIPAGRAARSHTSPAAAALASLESALERLGAEFEAARVTTP